MSGATSSVWLWLILVFAIFVPSSSSAEQINITAVSGENTTLPCRVLDGNKTINGLEWSKPELETEYVFMYRDSQSDLTNQHPSFKNRVALQDNQITDGNVSLILKNVTTADAGIYEVRISQSTKRGKRAYLDSDPICTFNLSVVPPGSTIGLKIVLPAAVVLVAIIGVSFIAHHLLRYRRRRKQTGQDRNEPQELDSSSSRSLDSLYTSLQRCKEKLPMLP